MWAAIGNALKNLAIKKAKKTAMSAAAGDESSQKKILIVVIAAISVFLIIIVVVIAVIFGPIMIGKEYIEQMKNSTCVLFEKINNVLTLNGWCAESDGSCSKLAEQEYYEELNSVYQSYSNKSITIDEQLITGTIFYGYAREDIVYQEDDDGYNQGFIDKYCEANAIGWGESIGCPQYVKLNYTNIYDKYFAKYVSIRTNYDTLSKMHCSHDSLIEKLNSFNPGIKIIQSTTEEMCQYYLWNYADLYNVQTDSSYIIYKERKDDIKKLAQAMVRGSRISLANYKQYLIDEYIPNNFESLIDESDRDKSIERIANEIMMFASVKDDSGKSSQFSYISNMCPEICLTSGQCYDLEDYIVGVVEGESGIAKTNTPEGYKEAWKAQAVAARTYALAITNWCKKPIMNNENNQVFHEGGVYHDEIKEVISETAGQVLTYDGEIFASEFDSFYFGNNYNCNGNFCYSTYSKRGPEGVPTTSHEIKSYSKWKNGFAGGHGRGMSQYGAQYLADIGWSYEEILKYFYIDNVEISYMGGTYASGEFTEELLFPLGLNSKNGQCVSAGNYYPGGSYHGAVDIAGWNMGYLGDTPTQIPVIASIGGKIVSLSNNSWCTARTDNSDTRLPYVSGCQGNYITIVVTDSNSKYYNYSFIYFHFDKIDPNLKVGDTVEKGQFLGYMGSTGNSTGYHLHFDIKNPSGAHLNSTPVPDQITTMISNYCKNNIAEG